MSLTTLAPSITYATQSVNGLAAAGSLIIASNRAIGTPAAGSGVTFKAAVTSFADTTGANFTILNRDQSKSLHLLSLKMIASAAGTGATLWSYLGVLDTTVRTASTENRTAAAVYCPNTNASAGNGFVLPTVMYQNGTTATTLTASSPAAMVVSQGTLGALNLAGDEFMIRFGSFDAPGSTPLTAAESAGVGTRSSADGPVIIAPNGFYTLSIWGAGSSASFNPDFLFFMAAL